MIYLSLAYTFFIIGLFGFGGGYGMLSLIQHAVVVEHHWMTSAEFTNIVAISQMTPGPIGINCATYCGYKTIETATGSMTMGVLGSLTATLALVLPSFILMLTISKLFLHYMHSRMVENIFSGLRPAVVGLMLAAVLLLCNEDNFSNPTSSPWQFYVSIAIFIATWVGVKIVKISPITMLLYAGFAGLLLLY